MDKDPVQSSPVDDVIEKRAIAGPPSFHCKSIDRALPPVYVILAIKLTSTRSVIRVIDGMKTLRGQYQCSHMGVPNPLLGLRS